MTTRTAGLGALLRCGTTLATGRPDAATVRTALADVAVAAGARGVAVTDPTGRVTAAYGEPDAGASHRLDVPLGAGGTAYGALALWRDTPFGPDDEQAAGVAGVVLALALHAARTERDATTAAVTAAEEERAALAADLHDDTLQTLVAARFATDLARRAGATRPDDVAAAVGDAIAGTRDVVWSLHPRTGSGALRPALDALADRLAARGVTLAVARTVPTELDAAPAAALYRLVQEAVALAVRRHGATTLRVEVGTEPGRVTVRLGSDGTAPEPAAVGASPLDRWVRRIEAMGGRVVVRPHPDWLLAELPGNEVSVP